MPRSYKSINGTYRQGWQQHSPPAGPSRGVCWLPQRKPFSQLPLLTLRATTLKALLVAKGTFNSEAFFGGCNVPWRSSQLCFGEKPMGFSPFPRLGVTSYLRRRLFGWRGFFFFLPFSYSFAFINTRKRFLLRLLPGLRQLKQLPAPEGGAHGSLEQGARRCYNNGGRSGWGAKNTGFPFSHHVIKANSLH